MLPNEYMEQIYDYLRKNSYTLTSSSSLRRPPESPIHKSIVDRLRENPRQINPDITDIFEDVYFAYGFGSVNIDLVALSPYDIYLIEARGSASESRNQKANGKLKKALFSLSRRFPGASVHLYRAYAEHGRIKLIEVPSYDPNQRVMITHHTL